MTKNTDVVFDLQEMNFKKCPIFEGEAFRCYARLIANDSESEEDDSNFPQEGSDAQNGNERWDVDMDLENSQENYNQVNEISPFNGTKYFMAKRLQEGGELYIVSARDEDEYENELENIKELIRQLNDIVEFCESQEYDPGN
jgi:phosphoglycolate phosphatase-like HAD superfamily hydrolase